MSGVIVQVSARKFAIPFECPCCGAAPDAELTVPLTRDKLPVHEDVRGIDVPYCQKCIAHAATWDSAGVVGAAVMLAGIGGAFVAGLAIKLIAGLAVLVISIVVARLLDRARRARAKAACRASCAGPDVAVAYLGWSGSVTTLSFASPTYAARFAEANPQVLLDVTAQLRRVIDGYRVARAAVPTPAAQTVVPPPIDAQQWVVRIEQAKGRVDRRSTLGRGLLALHEPSERELLIRTASRLELEPVLARLARLTDAEAKRTHLSQAIASVRVDNIPDELEAVVLGELEAQQKALG